MRCRPALRDGRSILQTVRNAIAVEFLSVKFLLNRIAEAPEAIDIAELDDAITWILARQKQYPGFAGAARQMEKLRRHLLAGQLRQARTRARLAIDFLG